MTRPTPPIPDQLQRLLDALDAGGIDPFALYTAIHTTQYTGAVTVHYYRGVPQQVDLGKPIMLPMCANVGKSAAGG